MGFAQISAQDACMNQILGCLLDVFFEKAAQIYSIILYFGNICPDFFTLLSISLVFAILFASFTHPHSRSRLRASVPFPRFFTLFSLFLLRLFPFSVLLVHPLLTLTAVLGCEHAPPFHASSIVKTMSQMLEKR